MPDGEKLELKEHNEIQQGLVDLFGRLQDKGYNWMDINAVAMGLCRLSMQREFGKEDAIDMDNAWRRAIGWDVTEN